MANAKKPERVILDLPACIVAWPHLTEPWAFNREAEDKDKRYSIDAYWLAKDFDSSPEWKEAKVAIHRAAIGEFGQGVRYNVPFKRGTERPEKPNLAPYVTANLKSKFRVQVADLTGESPEEADPALIEFGHMVIPTVELYPNDAFGAKRVSLTLKFLGLVKPDVDTAFCEEQVSGGGGGSAVAHFEARRGSPGGKSHSSPVTPAPSPQTEAAAYAAATGSSGPHEAPDREPADPLGDGDDIPF